MRLTPIFFALLAVGLAWSAEAQPALDEARDRFQAELERQCPDKDLQLLSGRDLRDGLDDYMEGLPNDVRNTLQKAETAQCSSEDDGVDCVNYADIGAADQLGRLDELATSICSSFLRCRSEGVCDYAE